MTSWTVFALAFSYTFLRTVPSRCGKTSALRDKRGNRTAVGSFSTWISPLDVQEACLQHGRAKWCSERSLYYTVGKFSSVYLKTLPNEYIWVDEFTTFCFQVAGDN